MSYGFFLTLKSMGYVLMSATLDLLHACCLVDFVGRGPEQQHGPTTRETTHEKKLRGRGRGLAGGFQPPGSAPRCPRRKTNRYVSLGVAGG